MLTKKEKQTLCLYFFNNDSGGEKYPINKTRLLIGSSPQADITLNGPHISFYHAFISFDYGKYTIEDLGSVNGVFVNGHKVGQAELEAGDKLVIGDLLLQVGELSDSDQAVLIDPDKDVKLVSQTQQEEVQEQVVVPVEGHEIIDGEYCDIHFDETEEIALENNPLMHQRVSSSDYVDYFEFNPELFESPPIDETDIIINKDQSAENPDLKIEVDVFLMGVLIEHRLLEPRSGKYLISSKNTKKQTIYCEELGLDEDIPLFDLSKKNSITPSEQDQLKVQQISSKEVHFTGKYNVQVIVQVTEDSRRVNLAPLFSLDQTTKKEAIKVFSLFFIFLLTMVLIPTTELVKEEESLSIVYRPTPIESPQPSTEQTSPTPSPEPQDHGVRETDVSQEAPQKAMAQTPQPADPPPEPKQAPPTPSPAKVAQAPEPAPQEPQQESFEINTQSRMQRLASNRQNMRSAEVQNQQREVASTSQQNRQDRSTDAPSRNVGTLGSDRLGDGATSAGARGLASREGMASTYMEPKTVVLGSMDPELLRKILREYLPQFRHCYQQELDRQNDKLAGVLDLNFRIVASGSIDRVQIEVTNAHFSGRGTQCMTNVLRMIEFPKPKGGGVVDVRQPLNFSSERQKI